MGFWASHGERGYVKPLDSADGAAEAAASEDNRGILAARIAPVGAALDDVEPVTPRAQSEIVPAAFPDGAIPVGPSRFSRVVPRGTAEQESGDRGENAAPEHVGSESAEPEPVAVAGEEGATDGEVAEQERAAADAGDEDAAALPLGASEPEAAELEAAEHRSLDAAQNDAAEQDAIEQDAWGPAPANLSEREAAELAFAALEAAAEQTPAVAVAFMHRVEAELRGPDAVRDAAAREIAARETAAREAVAEPPPELRESGIAPSHPVSVAAVPRAARPPAVDLGATWIGTGFGPDEEDEATMVDAAAQLTEEEQNALMRRIHSAMEETVPIGTPIPERAEPVNWGRSPFKQTMLMHLPQPSAPPPASASRAEPDTRTGAAAASAAPVDAASSPADESAALLASLVRVVGPPTQPPPRRARRTGAHSLHDPPQEPDHEAFALTNPITSSKGAQRRALAALRNAASAKRGPASDAASNGAPSKGPARAGVPGGAAATGASGKDALASPPSRPAASGVPTSAAHGAAGSASLAQPSLAASLAPAHSRGNGAPPSSPTASAAATGGAASHGAMHALADMDFGVSVGRSSFPGVILPPPPQPRDYEPASSPLAAPALAGHQPPIAAAASAVVPGRTQPPELSASSLNALASSGHAHAPPPRHSSPPPRYSSPPDAPSVVPSQPEASLPLRPSVIPSQLVGASPLRATLPPQSMARTRSSPTSRFAMENAPRLDELPTSDPFAGFVAPPPSLAQRWLVVVVVALAVVGLCSLAAIAFGLLGKTGW